MAVSVFIVVGYYSAKGVSLLYRGVSLQQCFANLDLGERSSYMLTTEKNGHLSLELVVKASCDGIHPANNIFNSNTLPEKELP